MNKIGFREALAITLENVLTLESETLSMSECTDRVAASDLYAIVDSPSVDASLKDGYAVRSHEIDHAGPYNPVRLKVIGTAAAGQPCDQVVSKGTAIRILTGAKIPEGADAVVAEEFTIPEAEIISVINNAEPGRNIFPKGCDVAFQDLVAARGARLVPGLIGILAAAGYSHIPVFKKPRVAIIATGDEVVIPGRPLPEGKLYASNLATLNAWCSRYGMPTSMDIVNDRPEVVLNMLKWAVKNHDAILTSGGAWTGDRDFVVAMLKILGWKQYFHRIRIGPGKAIGFGLLDGKPVFVLPGGPPSNLLAFLQIALPGLLKLGGYHSAGLPEMQVKLERTVSARDMDWTQFIFGVFKKEDGHTLFSPIELESRLRSISMAEGVIAIPEGVLKIDAGSIVSAQLLVWPEYPAACGGVFY